MSRIEGFESSSATGSDPAASELGRVLDEYLQAMEAGRPIPPEMLAALHPEIADRLLDCVSVLNLANETAPEIDHRLDAAATARLGDFELIEPIGRGGMGIVFAARQLRLNRKVALKILPLAAALDERLLGRFLVEAEAAGRLHHPNIVPVFAFGHELGVYFYAMRLIEGRSLAELIRELRGEAPAEARRTVAAELDRRRLAVDLGIQAADALEHAHRRGVIHRDIKPSNLMIDGEGTLWITDFGLARLEADADLTRTGDVLGTLRYMSPEQSGGDRSRLDHRTDVYSLGATLYELLTLHPAREAPALDPADPRPPRAWDPTIPRDLETIVLRALGRAPDQRYATAGNLAADLRRFRDGQPIHARRTSRWRRAGRWIGRHKPFAAALALVALLAVASAVAVSFAARDRQHARAERRAAYVRDVNQASQYLRRNALGEAAALLAGHVPEPGAEDDRTFAWGHLWRLCHLQPRLLKGHVGDVYSLTYSPDGEILATAGEDGTARLWNAATGALVRVLEGHEGDVDRVTFSPDGERLATSGDDGSIRLWSIRGDGPPVIVNREDQEVVGVIFSPDGRELISGDNAGRVRFWDAQTAAELRSAPSLNARVEGLTISPDGRFVAVAAERLGVRLINAREPERATDLPGFQGVRCVEFSHDGRLVAAGQRNGSVKIADLNDEAAAPREMEAISDLPHEVEGLAFAPNDRVLAVCGKEGHIRLLDVASGRVLRTYRTNRSRLWGVAFSPDGRAMVASGAEGAVELWDADVAQDRETMIPPLALASAIEPILGNDGLKAVVRRPSGEPRVVTWDLLANRARADRAWEPPPGGTVVLSPDGSAAAVHQAGTNPAFRLVSTSGGAVPPPLEQPQGMDLDQAGEAGSGLAFSADGAQLAAWVDHRGVIVWDAATGRATTILRGPTAPRSVAFSPRGDRLAMVYDDALRVRRLDAGETDEYPGPRLGPVGAVVFSPDGRKVVAGFPYIKILVVWDFDDPRAAPNTLEAPDGPLALAVSPGGETLATAGVGLAGRVNPIDLTTLAPIAFLDAPNALPRALRFSADGQTLLGAFAPPAGAPVIVVAWTADQARRSPLAPIDFGRR